MTGKPLGFQVAARAETALRTATDPAAAQDVVDEAVTKTTAYLQSRKVPRKSKPVACAEGCTHCCHIRVDASPLEVLALTAHLRQRLSPDAQAELQNRVVAADRQTRGLSERAHAATGVACPLLVDGVCSAYEARPFDCRGYESFDEAACRRLRGDYDFSQVPLNRRRYDVFIQARDGLLSASRKLGREAHLVELTAALRIALESKDIFQQWAAGERPFAPAALAKGS